MDQHNSNTGNNDGDDNENNLSTASKKKRARLCANCFKELERLLRCSKCLTSAYCDRVCQQKHWPMHKNVCRKIEGDDDYEKLANNYNDQGKC